jgi:hypothetical protein
MGIPTTVSEQYSRLRSYLSPYIRGPNTDAVLTALASSNAAYLIDNISAVNDQLYIISASGQYLDERLAQYGISRPAAVGLSDEVFAQIGIAVKNRKQVRDLMNQLLDAIFGDEYVRASDDASMVEPYALQDGDTLTFNLDGANTVTVTFSAGQFANIGAALAQEIADAIASSLSTQGIAGTAISKNDGNGNYVELISNTIGPASSVTVLGGSAQNALVFPSVVPAGGNMSTQWTLSLQPGGLIRFTWTGGANPQLGKVSVGNYVNIFGGGFSSSPNEGSFSIQEVEGGPVNTSFFEVENPLGTPGIITQSTDDAILFYNPIKQTLLSRSSYAAVFQTSARILQVFLPATTKVIRRSRIGSAHMHDPANIVFILNGQPTSGDVFAITSTISLTAGSSFVIGATTEITIANMVGALVGVPGIDPIAGVSIQTEGDVGSPQLTIWLDDPTVTLVGTYNGSAPTIGTIVATGLQGDPTSSQPNQQGPYMYDTTQAFTISAINTLLSQELDGTKPRIFEVENAQNFPDTAGYLMFGYGTQNQEGPVPYISRPSNDTLLISPVYTLQNVFPSGTIVSLVASNSPPIPTQDGLDYPYYITDVVAGREYAQTLIQNVSATGITVIFTILYPNAIGLGKWGTPYSEISTIYGP